MTKKTFMEKHAGVITPMWEAAGKKGDKTEICDKLIYMIRKKFDIPVAGDDVYPDIPEDFDWDAAYTDYKALMGEE